jgi:8-oxo-dGTP diphosphatase
MTGELILPADSPKDLIRAAGGIVVRRLLTGAYEVACVYREARGDWTFPKGKLDKGEEFEHAALREVVEETGLTCRIVRFVGLTEYTHRKGRPKIVAYFLMEVESGTFTPNDEVDELRWVPLDDVRALLTWERDQELVDLLVQVPELRAQAS